jgi:hypothetical protein
MLFAFFIFDPKHFKITSAKDAMRSKEYYSFVGCFILASCYKNKEARRIPFSNYSIHQSRVSILRINSAIRMN